MYSGDSPSAARPNSHQDLLKAAADEAAGYTSRSPNRCTTQSRLSFHAAPASGTVIIQAPAYLRCWLWLHERNQCNCSPTSGQWPGERLVNSLTVDLQGNFDTLKL